MRWSLFRIDQEIHIDVSRAVQLVAKFESMTVTLKTTIRPKKTNICDINSAKTPDGAKSGAMSFWRENGADDDDDDDVMVMVMVMSCVRSSWLCLSSILGASAMAG